MNTYAQSLTLLLLAVVIKLLGLIIELRISSEEIEEATITSSCLSWKPVAALTHLNRRVNAPKETVDDVRTRCQTCRRR